MRGKADGLEDWSRLLLGFAVALLLTATPIVLHLISQPIAIVFCVSGALFAARFMERDVPMIVIVANIFQNTVAALLSSHVEEYAEIEVIKSYSFLTTAVCWLYLAVAFAYKPSAFSPFVRKLIYASVAVVAVVGVYFILGLAVNPRNATVYLRNIGLPILMFQMFLIIASRNPFQLPKMLLLIAGSVAICAYIELFALDTWLTITNGWRYLTLFSAKRLINVDEIQTAAAQGHVVTNVLDYTRSSLFNTPLTSSLNLQIQRLQGPNFNTISFAYLLSSLIGLLALHRRWVMALLSFPLLLATSAKGPLVMAAASIGFYFLARNAKTNLPLKAFGVFLVIYAVFVFRVGYGAGDFHVLGLLGGVNGFLRLPIGHTLGDGGNLSIPDFAALKWSDFQHAGAADVAVESAFGVLLYQLGVAAFVWFAFYLWVASLGWRLFLETQAPALTFVASGILVSLANGLFQEEAYFAPFSLAFVMGFSGLILGATDRAVVRQLAVDRRSAEPWPDQAPSRAWITPRSRAPSSPMSPKPVE